MSQTVKLKRSAVSGKTPLTTQLNLGEVAINTADGKLFFKKEDGLGSSIVTLSEVTEDTLSVDTSGYITTTATSLSQVLQDLDTSIAANQTQINNISSSAADATDAIAYSFIMG